MEFEELLEKYIQHTLTKEEALIFNEILRTDEAKKKEVEFQVNLKNVATAVDDTNFRNLVSQIEGVSKNKVSQKTSYKKWLAAASIALFLGAAYFYSTTQTKVTNKELFASYFEPYRNVVHPIVRSTEQQQDLQTMAFMAYENGDFKNAITLFDQLYTTSKEPYYLFYKANSLLKLDKAAEAIPFLLEHLKTKDTLTEKTHWYLALAYINIEDDKKAKEALQMVIEQASYKSKDAKKLLKEFD